MGRYFLSSRAEVDMLAVWDYIAQDDVTAADRMIDQFTGTFERIAQYPESGERYEHANGELRRVVVAPYLVFYEITGARWTSSAYFIAPADGRSYSNVCRVCCFRCIGALSGLKAGTATRRQSGSDSRNSLP